MNMVIVTNAGNNELFQNCVMLNIIRKYFPRQFHPADVLPENPCAQMLLSRLTAELENGTASVQTLPAFRRGGWHRKSATSLAKHSHEISLARPSSTVVNSWMAKFLILSPQSIGLFPLFMQVFHNNMTEGVQKSGFFL